MSDRIRLLPEIVANQIAAGEVVEEPASVVKEMMENAVDAGARRVKVNFRNGGADLIQIIDDGCGMSPFDARMAFDRHTTSKISSVEDIYRLRTFGFRGEALASISAVSQVELRTRPEGDELGTETVINGGEFISQKPIMTPVGSNFSVQNLFYNVPARRKFLREPSKLASAIRNEFQRVALCYPEIAFELYANDQPVMSLPSSTLATRIIDVIGKHIKNNLLEVDADTSIVRIRGYVGRPAVAKKRSSEQYLFVNGRYFKSPYLNKAIMKAYEKLIPENSFPSYFIYITADPERVDVNVSPKKTEVKFADLEAVWQIINAAVRETLAKTGAVPMMDFDNESNIEIPVSNRDAVYVEPRAVVNEFYNPFEVDDDGDERVVANTPHPVQPLNIEKRAYARVGDANYGLKPNEEFSVPSYANDVRGEEFDDFESTANFDAAEELSMIPSGTQASFESVSYIGNGYAAALYDGRLIVVDLKRVKERILYDEYMSKFGGSSSVSQQLLFAERLVLSNDEYLLLKENIGEFTTLGFDIALAEDGAIMVKGVPADACDEGIDQLIFELLRAFDTPADAAELRRERLALAMARNGSARTPRNLSNDDARMMLERLISGSNISYSPSGKAIFIEITIDEIRAKLG